LPSILKDVKMLKHELGIRDWGLGNWGLGTGNIGTLEHLNRDLF